MRWYSKNGKAKVAKYRNRSIIIDGIRFQSTHEGRVYLKFKLLKKKGKIIDFEMQVPFRFELNGKWMFTYNADFVVTEPDGKEAIYDAKGYDKKTKKYRTTAMFRLKKKIIEEYHKVKIHHI